MRKKLLGYEIDVLNLEGAIDFALSKFNDGGKIQVVTINPEMIELAQLNEDFSKVLKSAELVIPDGVGVQLGFRLKGEKIERIAGIEFSKKLLEKSAQNGLPVAFLGAKPEVLNLAVENLKKEFSNLNVVYARDGYFSQDEEEKIANDIAAAGAKVVLVALGAPKQELFITKYKEKFTSGIFVGVGGSFDVWSGITKRAPVFFQKIGCEWLYRVATQPSRFKRIFPTLPRFLFRVIIK